MIKTILNIITTANEVIYKEEQENVCIYPLEGETVVLKNGESYTVMQVEHIYIDEIIRVRVIVE